MYCGDNQGTDIDHFAPISLYPLRTFSWVNHLLACSHCNSNEKRDKFPCDADGTCLLIDPTSEGPSEHLRLQLGSGDFIGLTEKGLESINAFGLNRGELVRGRFIAFHTRRAVLHRIRDLAAAEREDEAVLNMVALKEEPHAIVFHTILATLGTPTALDILGADTIDVLVDPSMQRVIELTRRAG